MEVMPSPEACADEMDRELRAEITRLRADNARLRANTERFPDLMARILEMKAAKIPDRLDRIKRAMENLPPEIHQHEWLADEYQLFGDKWVRSVVGDNGQGAGRQAIAAIPHHLTGLAEYIAAASPDTVVAIIEAYLSTIAALDAAEARAQEAILDALAAQGQAAEAHDARIKAEAERDDLARRVEAYEEMHAEQTKQGGPSILRTRMELRQAQVRADKAEVEWDAARAKALEDAALLAERRWFAWATLESPPECDVTACEEIAAAIRAMKEPTK